MAQSGFTPIQLYRTTTAAAAPLAANLAAGELAINTTDGILFYKDTAGSVQQISGSISGAGGAIVINTTTISANYTIASGKNGFSVGPITVSSGYAVTVSSGQRWVVL
tara:strand:- start:2678 stop:3001 length:324 start_codon:yes stop_codon:yes gene_type:complete